MNWKEDGTKINHLICEKALKWELCEEGWYTAGKWMKDGQQMAHAGVFNPTGHIDYAMAALLEFTSKENLAFDFHKTRTGHYACYIRDLEEDLGLAS